MICKWIKLTVISHSCFAFFSSTEKCLLKYKIGREYCSNFYGGRHEDKRITHVDGTTIVLIFPLCVDTFMKKLRNPWLCRSQLELNGRIFMFCLHTYLGGGYVRILVTTAGGWSYITVLKISINSLLSLILGSFSIELLTEANRSLAPIFVVIFF